MMQGHQLIAWQWPGSSSSFDHDHDNDGDGDEVRHQLNVRLNVNWALGYAWCISVYVSHKAVLHMMMMMIMIFSMVLMIMVTQVSVCFSRNEKRALLKLWGFKLGFAQSMTHRRVMPTVQSKERNKEKKRPLLNLICKVSTLSRFLSKNSNATRYTSFNLRNLTLG